MHSYTEKIAFVESIFGKGFFGRTGNLDVCCPLCNNPDKKKKKLAIKIETDLVHCWVCGYHSKNLKHLIRKFGNNSDFEKYKTEFAFDKNSLISINDEVEEKLELPKDFKLLVDAKINLTTRPIINYVTSRGLSIEDMWYYKLGYSNDTRWLRKVIVPSFDRLGNLNYFLGRSINTNQYKKYDNPAVEKSNIVFNEINIDWHEEIVLVEGVFDLFKCPINSIPLLGSELEENYSIFANLTENKSKVVLLLDYDMRLTKTIKIAKLLTSYGLKVKIANLPQNSDPGNLTKKEVLEVIKEAEEYNWDLNFSRKLELASKFNLSLR